MYSKVYRLISEKIRENPSYDERWNGEDKGLITCWEVGRNNRARDPELVIKVEKNELPVLLWKGGVEKPLKKNEKYGSLNYLAHLQGLRGENLDIDLTREVTLQCSRTKMFVTYTSDSSKYSQS